VSNSSNSSGPQKIHPAVVLAECLTHLDAIESIFRESLVGIVGIEGQLGKISEQLRDSRASLASGME